MPNSIISADLTIKIQDQLAVTGQNAQTFVNRVVPTLSFQSPNFAGFTGYLSIPQATSQVIVQPGVQALFLYIRNASGQNLEITLAFGTAPSTPVNMFLDTGGIFLYGDPNLLTPAQSQHYVTNVSLFSSAGGNGFTVAEYAVAY